MIRRPPRSTQSRSSAASDVYKRQIITGDGADEIFAGYNFLIQKDHTEIKNELKRMKEIMHFPSQKIANALGMSIEMPFIDENIIKMAETLPIDS